MSVRLRRRRGGWWYVPLGWMLTLLAAAAVAGCGGSWSAANKTPPGTRLQGAADGSFDAAAGQGTLH